jgi:hypothetical protein
MTNASGLDRRHADDLLQDRCSMNKEAQLTTMMVLSAVFALSGWALVYLSPREVAQTRGSVSTHLGYDDC